MTDDATPAPWWGLKRLQPGQRCHWRIGPLKLWLTAWDGEWAVEHESTGDPLDSVLRGPSEAPAPEGAPRQRFASTRLKPEVALGARCPDRPVLVRPETPFSILAGDRVTLFVGTAVFVTLAPNGGEPVLELPVFRTTDTWIGADTRSGILGYASRTSARTVLASLTPRPGRAVTRLTLVNSTRRVLAFERVVLPMPSLGLWSAADHRLWTDDVTYELSADPEGTVRTAAPEGAQRLSGPRSPRDGGAFQRAWATLFR